MYCDSICAFISNFTGSNGPYGDCLKLLCHCVCRSFRSSCCRLSFSLCILCLVADSLAFYLKSVIFPGFKKLLAVGLFCVVNKLEIISNTVKYTVIPFTRVAQDKHWKTFLTFIYSPLNSEFKGSNNNQVSTEPGFFGSVHLCSEKNLEIRLHPPVQTLHSNTWERSTPPFFFF